MLLHPLAILSMVEISYVLSSNLCLERWSTRDYASQAMFACLYSSRFNHFQDTTSSIKALKNINRLFHQSSSRGYQWNFLPPHLITIFCMLTASISTTCRLKTSSMKAVKSINSLTYNIIYSLRIERGLLGGLYNPCYAYSSHSS